MTVQFQISLPSIRAEVLSVMKRSVLLTRLECVCVGTVVVHVKQENDKECILCDCV